MDNTKGVIKAYTYGKLVFVNLYDCFLKEDLTINGGGWTNNVELVENLPECLTSDLSVGNIVFDNCNFNQQFVLKVYSSKVRFQLRGAGSDYDPSPTVLSVKRFNAYIVYISK